MFRRVVCVTIFTLSFALFSAANSEAQRMKDAADMITGRWDLTVTGADGVSYPSWVEITRNGESLTGRFVGRVGSQRPLKSVEYKDGVLTFSLPIQYERQTRDLGFRGRLASNRLEGETMDAEGKTIKWVGRRAPALERKGEPRWGKPVKLFNGRDLKGWRLRDPNAASAWVIEEGAMTNQPNSTDIITEQKFKDFKLHVEYKMVEKSNSGVYLRGRYEVQIQDDFGKEPESHRNGGVYGFITPTSNPVKKAGEWQTYDITLIGRRITVVLNGQTIVDNQEIPGITGGALDSNEGEPGPIFLQGDHSKIYYRDITITPARN